MPNRKYLKVNEVKLVCLSFSDYLFKIIVGLLGLAFIINIYLGSVEKEVSTAEKLKGILIEANEYLRNSRKIDYGTRIDCSSFSQKVYKKASVFIPRTAGEQYKQGKIPKDTLAGYLLFFTFNNKDINHVGIYLGNTKFIHSPGRGKRVRVDSLTNPYYRQYLAGFRWY